MTTNIFLSHYGVVLNKEDIHSYAFSVRLKKSTSLVREFNLAGIFYDEEENIATVLRIYFTSAVAAIFRNLGYEVFEVDATNVDASEDTSNDDGDEDEATEEDKEENVVGEISSIYNQLFYVEYAVSNSDLPTRRQTLRNHPTFDYLYNNSEKNMKVIDKKFASYFAAVSALNNTLNLQPDTSNEDEDDALTSAPRISEASRQAQFSAHREEQAVYRENAISVLDFFEEKVFGSELDEIYLTFAEAKELYGEESIKLENGESAPIFSVEALMEDIKTEIIPIAQ